jgi:phage gpG-like protein
MKQQTVEEFAAEFEGLAESFGLDQTATLEACKPVVLEGIAKNFDTASTSAGSKWPPRKPNPNDDGHPLLQETRALKAAATGQGEGKVGRIEDNTLILGVDKGVKSGGIPGAAVHQFGYPPRNIAQREYLGFSEAVLDECENIAADHAMKEIG